MFPTWLHSASVMHSCARFVSVRFMSRTSPILLLGELPGSSPFAKGTSTTVAQAHAIARQKYVQFEGKVGFQWWDSGIKTQLLLRHLHEPVRLVCSGDADRACRTLALLPHIQLRELLDDVDRFITAVQEVVAQNANFSVTKFTASPQFAAAVDHLRRQYAPLRPLRSEFDKRLQLCTDIEAKLQSRVNPGYRVKLFGSSLTGMFTAESDVDLACVNVISNLSVAQTGADKFAQVDFLHAAHEALVEYSPAEVITARVPLLAKTDAPQGGPLNWDLSCHARGVLDSQLILRYVESHPIVRPLCTLVKRWGVLSQVIRSKDRHFSSFSLSVALMYYLRREEVVPHIPPPTTLDPVQNFTEMEDPNFEEVARHFWGFLHFFLFEFEHEREVITLNTADTVLKTSLGWSSVAASLVLSIMSSQVFRLSSDVLLHMINYLPSTTLYILQQVSQRWRHLANLPHVWRWRIGRQLWAVPDTVSPITGSWASEYRLITNLSPPDSGWFHGGHADLDTYGAIHLSNFPSAANALTVYRDRVECDGTGCAFGVLSPDRTNPFPSTYTLCLWICVGLQCTPGSPTPIINTLSFTAPIWGLAVSQVFEAKETDTPSMEENELSRPSPGRTQLLITRQELAPVALPVEVTVGEWFHIAVVVDESDDVHRFTIYHNGAYIGHMNGALTPSNLPRNASRVPANTDADFAPCTEHKPFCQRDVSTCSLSTAIPAEGSPSVTSGPHRRFVHSTPHSAAAVPPTTNEGSDPLVDQLSSLNPFYASPPAVSQPPRLLDTTEFRGGSPNGLSLAGDLTAASRYFVGELFRVCLWCTALGPTDVQSVHRWGPRLPRRWSEPSPAATMDTIQNVLKYVTRFQS
eukprot:NODE_45_length_2777_cov_18.391862_g39_i0.p1 GENE.NODE_45_length_2777_cov_18.391862_g39_i0~~NODE_45_length_2777_cov_18.391862_g39_i0.p1  ORF type:complete len:877 (-),score=188.82 NODE_45_length_2777_cov_18.391862_g39_i0:146-2731(-)